MGLSREEINRLHEFNRAADELINSSFVRESKQKKLGINFRWERNSQTNDLDFTYKKSDHDEDLIKSLILTVRLFVQDNERFSIKNMREFYQRLPISQECKTIYDSIRDEFNKFLDESVPSFLGQETSRRELFDTIMYGRYAHRNAKKVGKIVKWESDPIGWDMAFFQFQSILHDFVSIVQFIKNLNKKVLNDYNVA